MPEKCQAENTPPSSLHSDLSQCTEMGHWPKKKHSSIPKLQYHWYENLGEAALPCSPRPLPCKVHASAKQVCALDEFQVRHLLHASAASAFAWTHPYDPMHTGLARPVPHQATAFGTHNLLPSVHGSASHAMHQCALQTNNENKCSTCASCASSSYPVCGAAQLAQVGIGALMAVPDGFRTPPAAPGLALPASTGTPPAAALHAWLR